LIQKNQYGNDKRDEIKNNAKKKVMTSFGVSDMTRHVGVSEDFADAMLLAARGMGEYELVPAVQNGLRCGKEMHRMS
jgi:hypothetical protein